MGETLRLNVTEEELRERIKELMKLRNLNMSSLGRKCNVPQSTISAYFNKNSCPNLFTLLRICDGLDVELSVLLDADYGDDPAFAAEERRIRAYYKALSPLFRNALMSTASSFFETEQRRKQKINSKTNSKTNSKQ